MFLFGKMKVEHVLLIIILVVVFVLVLDWFQIIHLTDLTGSSSSSSGMGMENLEEMNVHSKDEKIDYYVITMKKPERLENIEKQSEKLKAQGTPVQIQIVDAVLGVNLNLDELIEQKKLSPEFKEHTGYHDILQIKKSVGCYMSHLKIYDMIQEKNGSGYSVIFEDDFDIASEHFLQDIHNSLNYLKEHNLDFDILYLGTHSGNHGNLLSEKTYEIDKNNNLNGTHAMLINPKNIHRIINHLKFMEQSIDWQFTKLCHEDKLKAYVIFPTLVNPDNNLLSTIQNENFQQLTDSFKFSHF